MHDPYQSSISRGTFGGTMLSVLGTITYYDILKAALLAAIGALVSFTVSYGCRLLLKRFRR